MSANFGMLTVQNSCDFVLRSVRDSFLNYSIQETPFSLYLTVRKSFSRSKPDQSNPSAASNQIFSSLVQNKMCKEEDSYLESLKTKLKSLEDSNRILQQDYEKATNDSEESYKKNEQLEARIKSYEKIAAEIHKKDKIIDRLSQEKKSLESDLEDIEKNWKNLNKSLKSKDKEMHDIQKENVIVAENLVKVKTDLNNLTIKVNKEKKDEEKKQKKREKKEFLDPLKSSSVVAMFECNKCDVKTETSDNLKTHERSCHMNSISVQTEETVKECKIVGDKSVQTVEENYSDRTKNKHENSAVTNDEKFEKYPCFYCDTKIASKYHLNEHIGKCRGSTRMFCMAPVGLPFGSSRSHGFPPPRHLSRFSLPGIFF